MIQAKKSAFSFIEAVENPCLGCLSVSCTSCPCTGERPEIAEKIKALRVPAVKAKTKAQKKMVLSAEKQPPKIRGFESFAVKSVFPVPHELFGKVGEGVVLTADGDGMRNAGINNGDKLIFDIELQPQNGDIVIASVEGQMMCRRYFKEGDQYRIRREDGCTPDILTSNCVILGVLIGLSRQYANRR